MHGAVSLYICLLNTMVGELRLLECCTNKCSCMSYQLVCHTPRLKPMCAFTLLSHSVKLIHNRVPTFQVCMTNVLLRVLQPCCEVLCRMHLQPCPSCSHATHVLLLCMNQQVFKVCVSKLTLLAATDCGVSLFYLLHCLRYLHCVSNHTQL